MIRRTLPRAYRRVGYAGIVFMLSAGAACTGSTETPTIGTISVAGLTGVWRLELLQTAAQGAELTPTDTAYTLTLTGDTVSTRADCNACTGRFSLVGDSLTVTTGLACTRAFCPTQTFAAQFTRILAGESTVVIQGDTVWLVSSRGLLRFVRASTDVPRLTNVVQPTRPQTLS